MCEGMSEKDLADGYDVAAALTNGDDVYGDCLKYIAEIRRLLAENATLRAVWNRIPKTHHRRSNFTFDPEDVCVVCNGPWKFNERGITHAPDCPIAAAEKLMEDKP